MLKITKAEAYKYHRIFQKAIEALSDEDAIQIPLLYEPWKPDTEYNEVGKRVQYNGILYSVLIAHTSQETWTPDASPSLFARVLIPDPTVIPDWVQPDSTNPYMTGDKVKHNGSTWQSDIDNNVWEPGVYGWTQINE